jgi:hypothetical protein
MPAGNDAAVRCACAHPFSAYVCCGLAAGTHRVTPLLLLLLAPVRCRRVGKLVLVDLAGSERLRDTGSSAREAVRETGHINKSLFTLGQVR